MAVHPQPPGDHPRKRRAHKKSRRGCRNCKLRSVKCDETRPQCVKCSSFGVSCNYDAKTPDLQASFGGTAMIKALQGPSPTSNQMALTRTGIPASLAYSAVISDDVSSMEVDSQSLERLRRFNRRTVFSIGNGKTALLFKEVTFSLACSHPYLMHIVQTLTASHDRYLASTSAGTRFARPSPQTVPEIYHLASAAALFNAKLSAPIRPADRDALWATAALLGTLAFSWIDATTPEDAWPLRPAESTDLEWLRMSEQKAAIWNLTDPLRPESVFHCLKDDYQQDYFVTRAVPTRGVAGIPEAFVRLCGLDDASDAESSDYFAPCHVLVPLLDVACEQRSVVRFLSFISHMRPGFKRLLERKEPRALVLLAYWYAKVLGVAWWLEWRAVMECRATCLYLERRHGDMSDVMGLLEWPKTRCGLIGQ